MQSSASPIKEKKPLTHFIFFLFKVYRQQVIRIDCFILIAVVYGIVSPIAFRYLVNDAIGHKSQYEIAILMVSLFVGYLIATYSFVRDKRLSSELSADLIETIRQRFYHTFDHLTDNPSQHSSAQLITQVSTHLAEIEYFISHKASTIIYELLILTFGFFVLLYLNWILALASLAFLVVLAWLSNRQKKAAAALSPSKYHLENEFISMIQDSVEHHHAIQYLNIKGQYNARLDAIIARLHQVASEYNFKAELTGLLIHSGTQFLLLLIFILGCLLLVVNWIQIGDLIGFILMFYSFCEALGALALNLPVLVKTSESVDALEDLIFEEKTVDSVQQQPFSSFQTHITYHAVQLSDQDPAFDLTIAKHSHIGIANLQPQQVAMLIKTLTDKTKPYRGKVMIDDNEISQISAEDYYQHVAIVDYKPCIFNGSLRYNLLLDHQVEAAQLNHVLTQLQLLPVIEKLPDGLETLLPVSSDILDRQMLMRITLARMMLRDPSIIILDQTLSVFDIVDSFEVRDKVLQFCQDKTLIIVSNNLKHLSDLDRILLLEDTGQLAIGTHDELRHQNDFYKLMWSLQNALQLLPGARTVNIDPSYLKSIYLFESITDPALLSSLAETLSVRRFQANQVIFHQDDQADEAFIIAYGLVAIEKQVNVEGETSSHELARLSIGDFFGEIALLKDIPRTATARTLTPCYLLTLNYQAFMNFYRSAPVALHDQIDEIVSKRLAQSSSKPT